MRRRSAAWHDAQYNTRAAIPQALDILQSWKDRSAQTRARLRCSLDVPYTPLGAKDASERLDIFFPDRPTRRSAPVLVHLHGGYWRALHKEDQSFVAEPFVRSGALVVVPNYALCPEVSVAHIVMQMVQAMAWTWRHAAEHGGDPDRIVVCGHSAGGHLAAMLLSCQWPRVAADLPAHLVHSAVAVSGLFELEPLRHAPFLAHDLRLSEREARRLSPAAMPTPRVGQLLAFVGEQESGEFHRQVRLIRRVWGLRVVPRHAPVAGCHHMNVLDALADPATDLHRAAIRALGLSA